MASATTNSHGLQLPQGMEITGAIKPGYERILTPDALGFVAELARAFEPRRRQLMEWREHRQADLDAGALPDFLPETRDIREGDWTIRGVPQDLLDRRVEITGPTTRKMIVNALNSGASVFMADFEDALSPTWDECRRRPDQSPRLLARPDRFHRSGERQGLQDHRQARRADRPAARLASAGGAYPPRRPAGRRRFRRFRPLYHSTTPSARSIRAAGRISICPSWKTAMKRGSGTRSSRWRNGISACRSARSRRPS